MGFTWGSWISERIYLWQNGGFLCLLDGWPRGETVTVLIDDLCNRRQYNTLYNLIPRGHHDTDHHSLLDDIGTIALWLSESWVLCS
jgi:hypothetical protein